MNHLRALLQNGCNFAVLLLLSPCAAHAQQNEPPIIVTAPGGDFDADDSITIDREDLSRNGTPA